MPSTNYVIATIDVAHPPRSSAEAEVLLDDALRRIRLSGSQRILCVIHGYGSGGKGGTLKTVVKNWAFTNRRLIRQVIPGEIITPFNSDLQPLLAECELTTADLGGANEGATIIWVK